MIQTETELKNYMQAKFIERYNSYWFTFINSTATADSQHFIFLTFAEYAVFPTIVVHAHYSLSPKHITSYFGMKCYIILLEKEITVN